MVTGGTHCRCNAIAGRWRRCLALSGKLQQRRAHMCHMTLPVNPILSLPFLFLSAALSLNHFSLSLSAGLAHPLHLSAASLILSPAVVKRKTPRKRANEQTRGRGPESIISISLHLCCSHVGLDLNREFIVSFIHLSQRVIWLISLAFACRGAREIRAFVCRDGIAVFKDGREMSECLKWKLG